jgi:hypothetical protein
LDFRSGTIPSAGIRSTKEKPRRTTGLKNREWGPTCNKPHPFTFASQHVLGAGYNSLGHDSARMPSALTAGRLRLNRAGGPQNIGS